ncbi:MULTISPECIES: M23 family metallopeptidase [Myxococcaceae]|uniref:M23 family metallopeptidase n=1 Tax=Myxococcaceae TaxID=31 RepID=UPI001E540731|nr:MULTISPECIES: M23 family metallopeptidase [Myxococcaceae]
MGSVVLVSLVLGGAAGGAWWWKHKGPGALPGMGQQANAGSGAAPDAGSATAAAAPTVAPVPHAPPDALTQAGMKRAVISIDGPLETALVGAAGAQTGPALAQVVTRTLVWWVEVPRDLLRGDKLEVLYQERPNEEPLVHAVRFTSLKNNQTYRAYRVQPEGEKYARYYQPSGEELEMRLEHSPVDDFEQITSLLKDGRHHKGVDFKTAVGTPVKAPFNGVIVRKNWSWRANGNCLDLQESGGKGRHAFFLHLEELPKTLKVGDRFTQGAVLARSGNTGHSFAPHLHYQMMSAADAVIDPYDNHRTYRRSLSNLQRATFDAEVRRLDALLSPSPAAPAGGATAAAAPTATAKSTP